MASNFDPYWEWLKIPANQQPPNYYRLLGLKPLESDAVAIEAAINRLVEKMQRLSNGPQVEAAQKILNQVAAARICFNDATKKQIYDSKLSAKLLSQQVAGSNIAAPKPKPEIGSPSTAGRPNDSPRNLAGKSNAAAGSKSRLDPNEESNDELQRILRMKYASVAMLVLGGLVGSLFVWSVFRKPPVGQIAQQPSVNSNNSDLRNDVSVKAPVPPNQKTPPTAASSKPNSLPLNGPKAGQPQTGTLEEAALAAAGKLRVAQTEPKQESTSLPIPAPTNVPLASAPANAAASPVPTTTPMTVQGASGSTPAPVNVLQTIAGMPDTFVPTKSHVFERHLNNVVGLQGQVVSSRTSSSGKTVYLMFSRARNDLIEIRAKAQNVSLESLQTFVGKIIRVRGEIKKEFGSNVIGMEIDTAEQIEIVE